MSAPGSLSVASLADRARPEVLSAVAGLSEALAALRFGTLFWAILRLPICLEIPGEDPGLVKPGSCGSGLSESGRLETDGPFSNSRSLRDLEGGGLWLWGVFKDETCRTLGADGI